MATPAELLAQAKAQLDKQGGDPDTKYVTPARVKQAYDLLAQVAAAEAALAGGTVRTANLISEVPSSGSSNGEAWSVVEDDSLRVFYSDLSGGGPAWLTIKPGAGGGAAAWGDITGTLSAQTDLQSALDGKSDTSHNHDGTYAAQTAFDGLATDFITLDGEAITDSDMPMLLHNQTSPNVDPSSTTKTAALAALASYPEDGIHVFTDNVVMRSGDRLWMYNPWAVTLWNFANHEGLSMSATGAYYYRSGDGEEVPTQVTTFETAGVTIGNRSTANPTLTTVAGDWTAQPIQQWERGAANGGTVVAQIESNGAVTQDNTLTTKAYVDGRIWTGTQAAYDLLTPDADVLYVITG